MSTTNENAPLAETGEASGQTSNDSNYSGDKLRQQVLSAAEHLRVPLFNGATATVPEAAPIDIRPVFWRPSAAPDPVNARLKLEGWAIIGTPEMPASRKGFQPQTMSLLIVDFDTGNLQASQVQALVIEFFHADVLGAIYSTSSSQPTAKRWRLLVPFAAPVAVQDWLRLSRAFALHLRRKGCEVDATMERSGQISFTPNVPWEITDRSGATVATRNPMTGEPLHFEHVRFGSVLYDIAAPTAIATVALRQLAEQDAATAAEREAKRGQAAAKRAEREAQRQQQLAAGGDGLTPIERFNLEHSPEELMVKYGYIEDPQKPGHWRSPLQTSGTYATQVREDGTWFSLSGSDAAAGLGTKQGSGVGGDPFDLYVHFEHRGHRAKAVAIAGQQQGDISAFTGLPMQQLSSLEGVMQGASPLLSSGVVFGHLAELQGRPAGLAPDGKGGYAASKHNLMTALLAEGFCFSVTFDEFLGEVLVCEPGSEQWRPIREHDYFNAARCLEGRSFRSISTTSMREAILAAARERAFDSAQNWLNALAWDGEDRVGPFLEQAFGVAPSEYHTAISRYMWSALAGRVLQPGVKADMVPVVAGRQGAGKSSVVKAIPPFETGFGELNLATEEANLFREMRGRLVMELPELSGMRRKESEDLKRFVASTTNVWIEKYQTTKSVYQRRCLLFGTTNETAILNDPTGSRRWLPFECGTCNPQWVINNREQLWAQGAAMFKAAGVQYEAAERLAIDVHQDFRSSDPWEARIARWLQAPGLIDVAPALREFVTTEDVMEGLLIPTSQQDRRAETRVGNALKALGYERTRLRIDGKRCYVYIKRLI